MRGERPFIYHTPNGREMFQALQKILPALRTGAVNRSVGDAVLQWSAAEQMPLGYDVPSARRCRAVRPPWEGAVGAADWGRGKPYDSSPSVSASRCHLPRRGRQGENGLPRRFAPRNDSASLCGGGRLCPPKTRAPCRAGPACPAGETVSFAAGHKGPALQVISQGAMPTSPRSHSAASKCPWGRCPAKKASPGMYRGMRCVMGDCLTQ